MNVSQSIAQSCSACSHGSSSPWGAAPEHCARALERLRRHRALCEGEALFRQEEPNAGLHCVSEGVFGLSITHESGTDVLVGLAYPGDTLGARAFLRNAPHQTTAVALTPAAVCTIARRDALKLTQEAPSVHLELVRRCLSAMDAAQAELVAQAAMPTRARLCRLLHGLIRRHGAEDGGAHRARLPVSRAEMAGMLGIQPESLSRLFRRLKAEGLIDFSGRHVSARSLEALAAAAEGRA